MVHHDLKTEMVGLSSTRALTTSAAMPSSSASPPPSGAHHLGGRRYDSTLTSLIDDELQVRARHDSHGPPLPNRALTRRCRQATLPSGLHRRRLELNLGTGLFNLDGPFFPSPFWNRAFDLDLRSCLPRPWESTSRHQLGIDPSTSTGPPHRHGSLPSDHTSGHSTSHHRLPMPPRRRPRHADDLGLDGPLLRRPSPSPSTTIADIGLCLERPHRLHRPAQSRPTTH